mmetsp:Transcript_11777/g.23996  ORF Transcript_11777/g.23996 Transcript_11777/m.23996 type:complete len:87 (+) Transcript_11777:84-344(+)
MMAGCSSKNLMWNGHRLASDSIIPVRVYTNLDLNLIGETSTKQEDLMENNRYSHVLNPENSQMIAEDGRSNLGFIRKDVCIRFVPP